MATGSGNSGKREVIMQINKVQEMGGKRSEVVLPKTKKKRAYEQANEWTITGMNKRTSAQKKERANERTKEWMIGMCEKRANFLFIKRDLIDYWTNYVFKSSVYLSV